MKILFAGDINFRKIENLTYNKSKNILSELATFLNSVDYRIPNLETPLAKKENHAPIKKSGPNLICPPENVVFLKAFGADGVTLANNHIGDYGGGALGDTLNLLDKNGILHAGAGENSEESYRAMRFTKNGLSVSVLSVCENEFGTATKKAPGSAGYDPRLLLNKINEEKKKSNYVIIVFHGGNEFDPLPSPDTKERYRLLCDMGADAVIGGHTHCPQGYEHYNGKPIIYSLGNFLFKSANDLNPNDSWYYGYLCILDINESIALEVIPYKFDKEATKIHVFDGSEKEKMHEYLNNLSSIMQDDDELERYFKGWAWCHPWIPAPPKSLEKKEDYNVCGNMNLIFCQAHLSQCKAIFDTFYKGEEEFAKQYEKKIKLLQKMPV